MPPEIDSSNSGELSPVKRALVEIRNLRAQLSRERSDRQEPIAIVGMALRLPGGVTTPERFWQALAAGEDLIGPVPPTRWAAKEYLHPDPDHPGTMYDAHGGFLADVSRFDAEFFGINAREAESMDPQHRILLELAWEALERASIDPKTLANSATGVYIGISGSDYGRKLTRDVREIQAYSSVGNALSIAAGRISYFLALRGPSLAVDTACSSSLAAVQLAVESLRRRETNLALVGGSNLILSPDFNVGFARTRMLSRQGRSKTFDAEADGYVRAEGCCVLVLKRLSDAIEDGDHVLASIRGIAVNQDGRSAGITAPNGPSQEAVIRAALKNARSESAAVSYVEAHGTGTPLGDPIEARALGAVYGSAHSADRPLYIGSVKTNLGHTEAAAGLVGLLKVILMMQPGRALAPHLHFKTPNPNIDFESMHLRVPSELTPWPAGEGPRLAAVSSFGFSGTNAHVIVAADGNGQAPRAGESAREEKAEEEALLAISAANEDALRELAERYVVFLAQTEASFGDICFTAIEARSELPHRVGLRARSAEEAAAMLSRWLGGEVVEGLATSVAEDGASPGVPPSGDTGIAQMQADYVRGGTLRGRLYSKNTGMSRVPLPVYPFAPTSFWMGPSVPEERREECLRAWQAAVDAARRQSLHGPLGWRIDRYRERLAALERLTFAHARNILAEAGCLRRPATVDEVLESGGFLPLYRNLIGRWLRGLTKLQLLEEKDGRFQAIVPLTPVSLDPYWRDAERLLDDDPKFLDYPRQCGAILLDVLTGRVSALESLFPQGSLHLADTLYESGAIARYSNPIVAAAVSQAAAGIAPRRNVRILEIGGGTGGTTSAVLPLLPPKQVEYWFTDVTPTFLGKAQQKFKRFPFMHYGVFDQDRPLEEQGIAGAQFDVIIGANVVHAARKLPEAVERIRRLLAPGGLLVMLETTEHLALFDMTVGLIEGWQHSADDRREHPLLTPEGWKNLLLGSGFSGFESFPQENVLAADLGQHVLLAMNSDSEIEQEDVAGLGTGIAEWKDGHQEQAGVKEQVDFTRLPAPEREAALLRLVRETIWRVFRLKVRAEELGVRDRLGDLGMDSLIALELRSELVKALGAAANLPSTIAFDTGTVGELTQALLRSLETQADAPSSDASAVQSGTGRTALHEGAPGLKREPKPVRVTARVTAEELSEMSDEEVERLLNERLSSR